MRLSLANIERHALEVLFPRASIMATLIDTWTQSPGEAWQSVRMLIELSGLGLTEEMAAREALENLADIGLVTSSADGYKFSSANRDVLQRLALALYAISFYATSLHQDESTARLVLTRPPQPSELERQLLNRGWRTSEIETTREAFLGLVNNARRRVLVMTPFLDARGADWLCHLFNSAREGVERLLILRSLENPQRPDYPMGYVNAASRLRNAGVRVYNYSISRAGATGRETFHAKVVLCDADNAYVGSANLTAASEHSMELGVALAGRAAGKVAEVIEAVLACATPWPYAD
jgi:phosphatidylserine/phosphatidylglycerophosphate/cardiolipin synthase-like enzyme